MCIHNKILLGLIALTVIFYAVLVSNRYKLAKEWESKITSQQNNITQLQSDIAKLNAAIYSGDNLIDPTSKVKKGAVNDEDWAKQPLKFRLDRLQAHRAGSLWMHCTGQLTPQRNDGLIRTGFALPAGEKPRQYNDTFLQQNSKVYVFDSGVPQAVADEGGNPLPADDSQVSQPAVFLGVFVADSFNSDTNEVNISSVGTFTDAEYSRLVDSVNSGNEWFAYVGSLPFDSPQLTAAMLKGSENLDSLLAGTPEETRSFLEKQGVAVGLIAGEKTDVDELDLAAASEDTDADDGVNVVEADVVEDDGAVVADDGDSSADAGMTGALAVEIYQPNDGERYPVDFAQVLAAAFDRRDMLEYHQQKSWNNLDSFRGIICSQYAILGEEAIPDDVLNALGPAVDHDQEVQAFKQLFSTVQSEMPSTPEIAAKKQTGRLLAAAQEERDLVKAKLTQAQKTVQDLQKRIDFLISQNDSLASRLAEAQFESVDRITQQADRITSVQPVLKPTL